MAKLICLLILALSACIVAGLPHQDVHKMLHRAARAADPSPQILGFSGFGHGHGYHDHGHGYHDHGHGYHDHGHGHYDHGHGHYPYGHHDHNYGHGHYHYGHHDHGFSHYH